jgi:hypothetical protein
MANKKTGYMATIKVLIDVESEAEASDVMSSLLSECSKMFDPDNALIDWAYITAPIEVEYNEEYEEGDVNRIIE